MNNRLLKINLSNGEIAREEIPDNFLVEYIGGSGLAARILWDHLDPGVDPLDPRNPMLWITGPLTGSNGPTTGRFTICGRSPQTRLWGESNIGGFVGSELRYAGFDALLITGRSSEPVYLWIHHGEVDIRSAVHLWGKMDVFETQSEIRAEVNEPQARIACIGLAGENQVLFSGILSDHGRAAARTGMGALMGSKNLKAVAVRGIEKLLFASDVEFKKLRVAANKALLQENMTSVYRATGTSGAADYLQYLGDMPQKYWTQAGFEGAGKISGAEMAETILVSTSACQGCVISCGRVVSIKDGPYATSGKVKGPEYETICSFGSQLLVDDLAQITALGNTCDRLGLDTITTGNTIALAYLMFDEGIIHPSDTDGLILKWGDAAPCFDLLPRIAKKEGFGALLAQGSRSLAKHYGVEDLAVQVNGLDVAMHDPRAFSGQALVYLTSPRGACHNQSDYFSIEVGGSMEEVGLPMTDRFVDEGKAKFVAHHQHWRTVTNSLVYCYFAVVPPETIVGLLRAATGHGWDIDELFTAGERAWNLKRAYNCRLGLTPKSEKLPRLLLRGLADGGQGGFVPNIDLLLREYYAASGWDPLSGRPLRSKLVELNLGFVDF